MYEVPVRVPCVELIPKRCPRGLTVANCVYCKHFVDYIAEKGEIACAVDAEIPSMNGIDSTADYD